jgi:lactoylglutathione lyase
VGEHLDSFVEQLCTVLLGEEIAGVAGVEIAREDDLRPGCNSERRYQLPDLLQLVFGHDADTNLRFRSGKEKLRGRMARMELIHTCYRITDPEKSVAFYEALGFEKRRELPIRDEAINIFMGLPGDDERLELTFNFGVDSYELGTGYGHIAVTVDELDGTLERLAGQGIEPERPPYTVREGGSRLCFVRDPDGYRVELIEG